MQQFWVTVMHIALWSQLGVLVRIYLDIFFTHGCSGKWGVCLLSQGRANHNPLPIIFDTLSSILGFNDDNTARYHCLSCEISVVSQCKAFIS